MTENVPVRWDEELAKYANAAAALERPAIGRLAFRGGVMTYQGQPIQGNRLNVVIVGSAKEHALYQNVLDGRPFDPQKPEAPTCYALSLTGENMVPHADARTPKASDCFSCPYNAWGSNPNGGKGKACKEVRRLLVIPQSAVYAQNGAVAPLGSVTKAEAATASIPVTSLKNWANYTALLAGQFRRPPWAVVTSISVHPHARNQLEVKFEAVGEVPNEHIPDLLKRAQSSETIVLTPYAQESSAAPPQPMQNRRY